MFYITGDTHGNQRRWNQIHSKLLPNDIILVCGDFGVGFWDGEYWPEEMFFDYISEQKYTVLFIDGNHENFYKLNSYPTENWCNGVIHKIRNNILHLIRGEVYNIDGNTFFTMGGGYSVDKHLRVEGESWWPEEMPSKEEYIRAKANLAKVNYKVDFIITHTLPQNSKCFFKYTGHNEQPLNIFLEHIREITSYRHWYFGHVHADRYDFSGNHLTAIYKDIRNITNNEVI